MGKGSGSAECRNSFIVSEADQGITYTIKVCPQCLQQQRYGGNCSDCKVDFETIEVVPMKSLRIPPIVGQAIRTGGTIDPSWTPQECRQEDRMRKIIEVYLHHPTEQDRAKTMLLNAFHDEHAPRVRAAAEQFGKTHGFDSTEIDEIEELMSDCSPNAVLNATHPFKTDPRFPLDQFEERVDKFLKDWISDAVTVHLMEHYNLWSQD